MFDPEASSGTNAELKRLHQNFGYPSNQDFWQSLRLRGTRTSGKATRARRLGAISSAGTRAAGP
eukprot:3712155-Heterocapsa_arctica.AAC.1